MKGFFSNPWTIGIGTGIISGFIIFILTSAISSRVLKKSEKADRLIRIRNANNEVIATLKPYIADNGLPQPRIIEAIIFSVARKYQIDHKEMLSATAYCEELIREIVGSVYVSSERKKQYTQALGEYIEQIQKTEIDEKSAKESAQVIHYYSDSNVKRATNAIAVAVTALVSLLGISLGFVMAKNHAVTIDEKYITIIFAYFGAAFFAGILSAIATDKRRKKRTEKNESASPKKKTEFIIHDRSGKIKSDFNTKK